MPWGLIGAVASSAIKYGYDAYKRNENRKEKRDFFDYTNQANYGYYLRSLRESPLAQRQGLEDAGYNPMLALGHIGSSSYGGSSASSGDISTDGDLVGSAKQGAELANDIARTYDDAHQKAQAEIDNINADSELKEAQKNKTETDSFDNPVSVLSKLLIDFLSGGDNPKKDKVSKAAEKVGGLFGHSAEITDKAEKIGDAAGANLYGSVKQIADKVKALNAERESKRLQKRYEEREKASPRRGGKKQFDPYKANGGLVYELQKEYNTNRQSYERRHKYKQPIRRVIMH